MKRKIYFNLCIVGIFSIALSALLTLSIFYDVFVTQAERNLKNEGLILAASVDFAGTQTEEYLKTLEDQFKDIRITVISPTGNVVYESQADAGAMESHKDRPEIIRAREVGEGSSVRYSTTVGTNTYYYAKQLENGEILRVAKQSRNMTSIFTGALPAIVGLSLAIFLLCLILSSVLTKWLTAPIVRLADRIDTFEDGDVYDELAPFIRKIKKQNDEIQKQIQTLKEERDTIGTIISNMREGLILINRSKSILEANESAVQLLQAKGTNYSGKNLLAFSRDPMLISCAERALSGVSSDEILELGGQSRRILASPVLHNGALRGAVLLVLDVTEQRQNEKMRRDFTANVSHELKTPITSILGYAEMIKNDMVPNQEDLHLFASRICAESERLIGLIDDIIRLSEIEETTERQMQEVDLLDLSNEVSESLEMSCTQKNITIEVSGEAVKIQANERMIHEMLYNLCDNAIKYNREGGRVDVKIEKAGREAKITVSDTGIGIPPQHQARIFERFYRVDKSRSRQSGGTGLGLSIVKHVVEYHKGRISLKSRENVGTTIEVVLPLE